VSWYFRQKEFNGKLAKHCAVSPAKCKPFFEPTFDRAVALEVNIGGSVFDFPKKPHVGKLPADIYKQLQ
jgi:hypothetical protein